MMTVEAIRHRLILRRKALGLSQRAVAERMGLGPASVAKLEQGRNPNPGYLTLAAWANAVGLGFHTSFTTNPADVQTED